MQRMISWTVIGSCVALAGMSPAQVTARVSVSSGGAQPNDTSHTPSVSPDGRYVAFDSFATNLVSGDTNGARDVFVRDRLLGTTERVSVSSTNGQGNAISSYPSMSADGRYVAFHSPAFNLVSGDTNSKGDIFVRDRQLGTTVLVSVDSGGAQGNEGSSFASISADGRFVAFMSGANNFVPGDTNGADIFVHDRQLGTTERVSVDSAGMQGDLDCRFSSISADGRYVAFTSRASNLVPGDTNGYWDIFVRDRQLGTTERVSIDSGGVQGNGDSPGDGTVRNVSISADGLFVAFESLASNLVSGDTNGLCDIFVRDRQLGTTQRASVASGGVQGIGGSFYPSMSADGRYTTFQSSSSNLVSGDTNGTVDVFLRDRQLGTTERLSLGAGGVQGNDVSGIPWISAAGDSIVFVGLATNLVVGDTNAIMDIFVRDRFAGPSFTSLCEPGVGGVQTCPCSNPPSGGGRGCNNSAATGGAILSAAGGTYLSSDSLQFTTSGEKPTATSVLLQGTTSPAAGVIYGQGIRCVGGTLKRLFTKTASAGSITAPNFAAGDPTVSTRSAALGSPISAGQTRWYLVFYRDPIVLGGCPSSSAFNTTQTGAVVWSP